MFYGWDNRADYMYLSVCKLYIRLPHRAKKYGTRRVTKGHISKPAFSAALSKVVSLGPSRKSC